MEQEEVTDSEKKIQEIDDSIIATIEQINAEIHSLKLRRDRLAKSLGTRKCPICRTNNYHFIKNAWVCAFC